MYILTNTNPRFCIYQNLYTVRFNYEPSDYRIPITCVDAQGMYKDRASEDIIKAVQIWHDRFQESVTVDEYLIQIFGFQEWNYGPTM